VYWEGILWGETKASINKIIWKDVRGKPLSIKSKRRNKIISRKRPLVERSFAVFNIVYYSD
jgi:hypothetical protein